LIPLEKVAEELGFEVGEHLELAYEIDQILTEKFDESMNFNAYTAAFLSDQGFKPQEVYQICSIAVTSGVTACYVDSFERPAEAFLPLRCDDIEYQGPPSRKLPLRDLSNR